MKSVHRRVVYEHEREMSFEIRHNNEYVMWKLWEDIALGTKWPIEETLDPIVLAVDNTQWNGVA